MPDHPVSRKRVEDIGCQLRRLRNNCGGCGVDLDGDRRQYCRQCKTYCYCSRECQKLHWNRIGEGGHAHECKKVQCLKKEIRKNDH